MRTKSKEVKERTMELHFPHLTNGIAQPKRIRKSKSRKTIVAFAIATVACLTAYAYK